MTRSDTTELDRAVAHVRRAPRDAGRVELIVRRPRPLAREVVAEAELDPLRGLVGDGWLTRGSRHTADGSAHPGMQLTLMGVRAIEAVAGDRERWPLAGDQLFVDLDLSEANLPPGTRLTVGGATIAITETPHTGCDKFVERFGAAALRWVSSPEGRALRLRGVNARVDVAGVVRVGDLVRKADV